MLIETSQRKTNTNRFHLYVDSNKQNKLINKIETDSYIQRTDCCQKGGVWGGSGKRVKGLRKKKKPHLIDIDSSNGDCQKERGEEGGKRE